MAHGISGIDAIVKLEGFSVDSSNITRMLPMVNPGDAAYQAIVEADKTNIYAYSGSKVFANYYYAYVTLYYTKN